MAKHTPGPWRVKPMPSHVSGCREIQAGKSGDYRQAQWGYGIASTHGCTPDAEDKANALLIAAAPDLAAACVKSYALIDALMPGLRHISVQDYAAVNDTPLALSHAMRLAGVTTDA